LTGSPTEQQYRK